MKRILILNILFLFIFTTILKAYDGITPGEKWNDTNGTQINAHGGCVVFHEGAYYWFGEDRNVFYSNGVSCYKSSDLYNWTKLGMALTPSGTKDANGNDIAPGRIFERPKVIYNNATGKWVMQIHWENGDDYGDAKVCVATSDKIQGPYTFYKTYRPNGHDSRDQTLFKDTDGKAYHFGTTNMNSHILVSELTNNYLEVTDKEYLALKGMSYEAPAIFKVGDTYFGLFSGCTGWDPNPGRTAYTFDLMDEWTAGDNFAVDLGKETSYKSQSAYVFKVNGHENAYVYVGDRWISTNPGSSNVVWLPLSIRSGYPTVKWMNKWDVSVFDEYDRYKRAKEIYSGNTYLLLDRNSNRLISKTNNNLVIDDDNETLNLKFNFFETEKPYVYKIQESGTGKFFESIFGSLRLNTQNNSKAQEWLFLLQEDGYYKIKNLNDSKYLAISGGGTFANSGVYLSDASKARCFGVYFDSNNFEYEAADIFSANYRAEMKILKDEQTAYLNLHTSIGNISDTNSVMLGIQILDVASGRLVKQLPAQDLETINLSGQIHPGVYIAKIIYENDTVVKKIIVK